jgi:type I site-specific restriction endonuclease
LAIDKTIEAIAKGQNRTLLVIATDTGKTFTAFQIIWRLWQSKAKKQILVLADRNILVDRGRSAADSAGRQILDYFSAATQVGLTATPKETKEVSNYGVDYAFAQAGYGTRCGIQEELATVIERAKKDRSTRS